MSTPGFTRLTNVENNLDEYGTEDSKTQCWGAIDSIVEFEHFVQINLSVKETKTPYLEPIMIEPLQLGVRPLRESLKKD